MFYKLLQDYTHHGGTIKRLVTIPKGTLVTKEPSSERTDEKGFEYSTVSYGDYDGYFLMKEVVENNPEFFRELSKEEYTKAMVTLEFKNSIIEASESLSVIEIYDAVTETFQAKEENPEPIEEFKKQMDDILSNEFCKTLMDEINKVNPTELLKFPNLIPNETLPKMEKCHCGNDGTKPCWSIQCPQRLIITYSTGSSNASFNPTWTVSTTIHNINKNENNDQ
jgi:hypothetical protein